MTAAQQTSWVGEHKPSQSCAVEIESERTTWLRRPLIAVNQAAMNGAHVILPNGRRVQQNGCVGHLPEVDLENAQVAFTNHGLAHLIAEGAATSQAEVESLIATIVRQ